MGQAQHTAGQGGGVGWGVWRVGLEACRALRGCGWCTCAASPRSLEGLSPDGAAAPHQCPGWAQRGRQTERACYKVGARQDDDPQSSEAESNKGAQGASQALGAGVTTGQCGCWEGGPGRLWDHPLAHTKTLRKQNTKTGGTGVWAEPSRAPQAVGGSVPWGRRQKGTVTGFGRFLDEARGKLQRQSGVWTRQGRVSGPVVPLAEA